jgi:DNA (cytosine-5)-methyltransferase 1
VDLQNTRLGGDLAGTLDTGRPCRGGGQAIMAVSYAAGDTGSVMANGKAAASATSQDAHNGHLVAYGGNNTTGPIDVATAVRAKGGSGHGDFESETFIAIAIPIDIRNATREDARTGLGTSGTGIGNDGDPMHTIGTAQVQGVATAVRARAGSRGVDSDCPDTLIPTLAQPLRANGHDASEDGAGRTTLIPFVHAFDARQADVIQYGDLAGPLDTDSFTLGVDHPQRAAEPFTFDTTQITSVTNRSTPTPGLCHTLAKGAHAPGDAGGVMKVRRLTPREMERLQGFPDGYTLIPREKAQRLEADMLAYYRRQLPHATEAELRQLAADGPRAKALGNSMACNVMAWLGRRLLLVDAILNDPLADWHDAP